jgi:hypothetical protein
VSILDAEYALRYDDAKSVEEMLNTFDLSLPEGGREVDGMALIFASLCEDDPRLRVRRRQERLVLLTRHAGQAC